MGDTTTCSRLRSCSAPRALSGWSGSETGVSCERKWTSGATRVMAGGAPVLVQSGSAVCTPTGVPLMVVQAQVRVTAT